nr:MAG TPA: RRN7 Zinc-finger of RNA-polymerase I-specific TFIIB, Rrn7 [Caudoviricetes sp.]
MAVARTCIRCNRKFLAKKDEQYCKQCAKDELTAILNKDKPKEEPPKEVKEKKCRLNVNAAVSCLNKLVKVDQQLIVQRAERN